MFVRREATPTVRWKFSRRGGTTTAAFEKLPGRATVIPWVGRSLSAPRASFEPKASKAAY
jgi:hypothetical protein